MDLNESNVNIKGQILRMKPRSTLDAGYSSILMEEQQRATTTIAPNNLALMANKTKDWKTKKEYQSKERTNKGKEWKNKKSCDNCKKIGHTTNSCYCTKGFPANHPLHGVFPIPVSEKTFTS